MLYFFSLHHEVIFNSGVVLLAIAAVCCVMSNRRLTVENRHFKKLAFKCSLTGAPNRTFWDQILTRMSEEFGGLQTGMLQKLLSRKRRKVRQNTDEWSLVLLDIDHFKAINDHPAIGHSGGDAVLKQIVKIFHTLIRENDFTFARLGGDEFGFIIQADAKGTDTFCNRLVQSVSTAKFVYEGMEIPVTISVGAAPMSCGSMDLVIKAADEAAYVVKQGGRNGYHLCEKFAEV